jgi:hypothetical protein
MASMLGHALGAGAALGLASRIGPAALASKRAVALAVAVGIIPELDRPLSILLNRPACLEPLGPSHSLLVVGILAALAATAAIWGALKPEENPVWGWFRAFLAFSFVGAAGLVLDWLTGPGQSALAPLWPFSGETIRNSPVQVIPSFGGAGNFLADDWSNYFAALQNWRAWVAALLEAVILVPALLFAWGKVPAAIRWPIAGLSAAGMLVTFILYQLAGKL